MSAQGVEVVDRICDELATHPDFERWASILFLFVERLDGADLGSPGPIVHTLEQWDGYQRLLVESVRRKPTPLTIWMVNRVLNVSHDDADFWGGAVERC